MIKGVTHAHLGTIRYLSEPSYVPYSPHQFLGWDFFCSFLHSSSTEPSKRGDKQFRILVAKKKGYAHPDRQLKSQIELSILSHFQKNERNHCSSSFPPALKSFSKTEDGKMGRWDQIKKYFPKFSHL